MKEKRKREPLRKGGDAISALSNPKKRKVVEKSSVSGDSLFFDEKESERQKSNEESEEESEDEEEDEDDDINLSNNTEQSIEQFTFEFNDMKDEYFHGIRTLLTQSIIKLEDVSALSDFICHQATVGTVVNSEGENDVFAFATILPFETIQESAVVTLLKRSIEQTKCLSVLDLLNHQKVGFVLHSRFTNFPPQLIYELHRNLMEDVKWAKAVDVSAAEDLELEVVESFKTISHLFLISPCTFSNGDNSNPQNFANVLGRNDIIFSNFEDEFYFQEAQEAYHITLPSTHFKASHHVLVVVDIAKIETIVNNIKSMLL